MVLLTWMIYHSIYSCLDDGLRKWRCHVDFEHFHEHHSRLNNTIKVFCRSHNSGHDAADTTGECFEMPRSCDARVSTRHGEYFEMPRSSDASCVYPPWGVFWDAAELECPVYCDTSELRCTLCWDAIRVFGMKDGVMNMMHAHAHTFICVNKTLGDTNALWNNIPSACIVCSILY